MIGIMAHSISNLGQNVDTIDQEDFAINVIDGVVKSVMPINLKLHNMTIAKTSPVNFGIPLFHTSFYPTFEFHPYFKLFLYDLIEYGSYKKLSQKMRRIIITNLPT